MRIAYSTALGARVTKSHRRKPGDPAKPTYLIHSKYANADLDLEPLFDQAEKDEWRGADHIRRLQLASLAVGRIGGKALYRALRRELCDDPRAGCPNRVPLQRRTERGLELAAVDCGGRACPWCGPRAVGERAEDLAQGFAIAVGMTYQEDPTSRILAVPCGPGEATSKVRWLSRQGFAAVVFPRADGDLIAVGSTDGLLAGELVARMPSSWVSLPWEDLDTPIRQSFNRLVEEAPDGRRIRPNALLAANVEQWELVRAEELSEWRQDRAKDRAAREDSLDEPRREPSSWAARAYAIGEGIVAEWSSDGQPLTVEFDDDDDGRIHEAIMAALTRGPRGQRPTAVAA